MKKLRLFAAVVTASLLLPSFALAASGDTITRPFNVSGDVPTGSIVSSSDNQPDSIVPATTANASKIIGVAMAEDSSLIAIDPDDQKTQVASSGQAQVLVSTINGEVQAGDAIAVSPFAGIGMKARMNGYIVGRATAGLNATSAAAQQQTVTDKAGKATTISVGLVPVRLAVGYDATLTSGGQATTGLQKFVRSLTGRTVTTPRIIMSLIIIVLTIIIIVVLLYAAIYGSIVSISRNPLAKESILVALSRALLLAAVAVLVAFGFVFLLLR